MTELITFQTFSVLKDAIHTAEKLEQNGIITEVCTKTAKLDAVFIGSDYVDSYDLKIEADSFNEAYTILLQANPDIDINTSHPLYTMSNEELHTIIAAPDEWGADNYIVAKTLLKKRGLLLSDSTVKNMREKRIDILAQKKSIATYLLVLGYGSAIFPIFLNVLRDNTTATRILWYFPGVLGLIIGLIILQSKNTLPNGKRIYVYDNKSLKQGLIILILNILSWVINIAFVYYLSNTL